MTFRTANAVSLEEATRLVNEIKTTAKAMEFKKSAVEQRLEKLGPLYSAGLGVVVACSAITIGTAIYRAMK